MRLHVVGLPHTQTTRGFVMCAYTEKVRKFCVMMRGRGHSVYLYAGERNDAPCDELIPCITEADRRAVVGDQPYIYAPFNPALPHWQSFNARAASGIRARMQTGDIICVIAGIAHAPIARSVPELKTVEFGIGYGGVFAKYRVWESYAWMHTVLGAAAHNAHAADGSPDDTVIPNYFEREAFPFRPDKGAYFLFMGRLTPRKGPQIAADVCRELGVPLIVAGQGTPPPGTIYLGPIGSEARGSLMSQARAVFVPTQYVEPFGGVAVEAMMCGTPVITTDWGAFTETVPPGVGFRCRTHTEFVAAARKVHQLDPHVIHQHAVEHYSLEAVAPRYDEYLTRIESSEGQA